MQYRVKHQFADFVVQTVLDNNHVQVFVVSDDTSPTTAELDLTIYRLAAAPGAQCSCAAGDCKAGGANATAAEPVWTKRMSVAVPALNAALAVNASAAELLGALPKCTPATCFLRASARAAATRTKPGSSSAADLFFKAYKDLKLEQPRVQITNFKQEGPGAVSFDVGAGPAAALLVVLETELRGRFDDNMFNLQPCGARRVAFAAPRGGAVDVKALAASIGAATLWENQLDDPAAPHEADEAAAAGAPAPALPPLLVEVALPGLQLAHGEGAARVRTGKGARREEKKEERKEEKKEEKKGKGAKGPAKAPAAAASKAAEAPAAAAAEEAKQPLQQQKPEDERKANVAAAAATAAPAAAPNAATVAAPEIAVAAIPEDAAPEIKVASIVEEVAAAADEALAASEADDAPGSEAELAAEADPEAAPEAS
jgi:hypothetical protein